MGYIIFCGVFGSTLMLVLVEFSNLKFIDPEDSPVASGLIRMASGSPSISMLSGLRPGLGSLGKIRNEHSLRIENKISATRLQFVQHCEKTVQLRQSLDRNLWIGPPSSGPESTRTAAAFVVAD